MKKRYFLIVFIILMFSISSVSAGIFTSLLGEDSPVDEENDFEIENVSFYVYAISPRSTAEDWSNMDSDPVTYNNNDTRDWMEGLEGYVVLPTNGDYLVMNETDALKLPVIEDKLADVSYNNITCKIVEAHSPGNGMIHYLLVEDVELQNTFTKTLFEE